MVRITRPEAIGGGVRRRVQFERPLTERTRSSSRAHGREPEEGRPGMTTPAKRRPTSRPGAAPAWRGGDRGSLLLELARPRPDRIFSRSRFFEILDRARVGRRRSRREARCLQEWNTRIPGLPETQG